MRNSCGPRWFHVLVFILLQDPELRQYGVPLVVEDLH